MLRMTDVPGRRVLGTITEPARQTDVVHETDVLVIGGGPAGSTASARLSRMGHDVLLLEREKFPREHVGESLLPFAYHLLKDLGVVEELERRSSR